MKRLDEGKVSLVDFLRSIKYAEHRKQIWPGQSATHFAQLSPRDCAQTKPSAEDASLIRSVN